MIENSGRRPAERCGWRIVVVLGWLAVVGCGADGGTGPGPAPGSSWTAEELLLLRDLALDRLPALAPDPSNQYGDDLAAAALGEQLFTDTRLSGNGAVACGTCHVAAEQFQDGLPLAHGLGTTARRTMPVMGTAYNTWQFWDGRKDSQWSQALGPLESAVEHGSSRLALVRVLADHYATQYQAVFGPLPDLSGLPDAAGPVTDPTLAAAWAAIPADRQDAINRAFVNLGKAIAAFERRVGYGASRFDRFVEAVAAGQAVPVDAQLSADEQAGASLFVGKGRCITCHTGPLLTDQRFHNVGVANGTGQSADEGRWSGVRTVRDDPFNCLGAYSDAAPGDCSALAQLVVDNPATHGAFKTPSLRNVAERAPYMHAGQLATLDAVMAHYNTAPAAAVGTSELVPLQLTDSEQSQLVAFMRALSGAVVLRQ